MKLRGHDGAVLEIAFWDQAMYAHARAGKLRHGFFEGRKVICWEPPAPPKTVGILWSFSAKFQGLVDALLGRGS